MTNKNIRNIIIIAAAVFTFVWPLVQKQLKPPAVSRPSQTSPSNPSPSSSQVLGVQIGNRTKTSGCQVNGRLPDSACTPGAVFSDATVDKICVAGYSKNVRNVSDQIKNQVFAQYGITSHQPGEYEVDHLISLELGGSNDIANLWPEAALPTPGFHQKDKVENYLHQQVCSGAMKLDQAQKIISSDWTQALNSAAQ